MGVYTGSGPTDPVVGNKVSVTNFGVPTSDAVQALATAWTSYTPTVTGFTLGNGTATGAYTQVGKFVVFRAVFTFGSTSAAASSPCILTLPVAPLAGQERAANITARFVDSGTAFYAAVADITGSTVRAYISGTNGIANTPSTTAPFTWTTSDSVQFAGCYEAS